LRTLTGMKADEKCVEPVQPADDLDWLPFLIIPTVFLFCCLGCFVWFKRRNRRNGFRQQEAAAPDHSPAAHRLGNVRPEGEPPQIMAIAPAYQAQSTYGDEGVPTKTCDPPAYRQ